MYLIPALGRLKQEDYPKASLGDMAGSGPASATLVTKLSLKNETKQ